MAIIGGFFKKQKHQRFEYRPRYWDPNKEDLENRIKAAQGESENDPESMKRRISSNLRRSYKASNRSAHASSKRSTIMLIVIIAALVVLSYYFLTVYLPVIEQRLGE